MGTHSTYDEIHEGAMIKVREHGKMGPVVVVIHGGPGARGSVAPVARELADAFQVIEPWQRGSSDEPLTVARHIADLHEIVQTGCHGMPPALVGESWGAMLALAYAAKHPDSAGPIVLIGCGTFDPEARACFQAVLSERMDDDLRQRLDSLQEDVPDADERLKMKFDLIKPLYSYNALATNKGDDPEVDAELFDVRANKETWADMLRLQQEGVYPAVFTAITSPVLMLHGACDPHPGKMIQASLKPYLPQLEYREWDHCGHSPWEEKGVRNEFFTVLRDWLARRLAD